MSPDQVPVPFGFSACPKRTRTSSDPLQSRWHIARRILPVSDSICPARSCQFIEIGVSVLCHLPWSRSFDSTVHIFRYPSAETELLVEWHIKWHDNLRVTSTQIVGRQYERSRSSKIAQSKNKEMARYPPSFVGFVLFCPESDRIRNPHSAFRNHKARVCAHLCAFVRLTKKIFYET